MFAWTLCIRPILAAIVMLASTQETLTQGSALLSVYSAGPVVSLLLVAVGTRKFLSPYQRWTKCRVG